MKLIFLTNDIAFPGLECHLNVARTLIGRCRVSQPHLGSPLAAVHLTADQEGGTFPSKILAGDNFFVCDL